jgi:sugar phosphate isomerase/epimerase
MQLGIFAKTFAGSAPAVVMAAAARSGYRAVQYNMACSGLPSMPDAIPPGVAEAVATAAKQANMDVVAVSGTYNMIHPDPSVRSAGLRRLRVLAGSCAAMGTKLITLCTGTRDPVDQWRHHPDNASAEAWNDLLAEMEKAIAIAGDFNLDLGIEPELANVIDSAAKARLLISELQSPRIRIILDAANLFETGDLQAQRRIVAESIDLLAGHVAMAHAKDRDATGNFVAAGSGVLDYDHYLSCLVKTGFNGPLVTHGLEEPEAPSTAEFLHQAMVRAGATS